MMYDNTCPLCDKPKSEEDEERLSRGFEVRCGSCGTPLGYHDKAPIVWKEVKLD
jgi:hypothetical protein